MDENNIFIDDEFDENEEGLKTFLIPVSWKMYANVEVKASTMEEAIEKFEDEYEDASSYYAENLIEEGVAEFWDGSFDYSVSEEDIDIIEE